MSAAPRGKKGKKVAAKSDLPEPSRTMEIARQPGHTELESVAAQCLNPQYRGAILASALVTETMGKTDLMGTVKALRATVAASKAGDSSFSDEMLISHAYVLDSLFMDCIRRWSMNTGHNWQVASGYLNAALRAQAQARTALESLSKIKNPPSPTFVRQANIANGPQQVNNGLPAHAPRTEETPAEPIELKEIEHEQRVDFRAQGQDGRGDQDMETVGAIDRTEDP